MLQVFISQPMSRKTNEEIKEERRRIVSKISDILTEPFQVIDSFFESAPHDAKPLWFLGKSIELLSSADLVYFSKGWENARGCRIEHACAVEYMLDRFEE
jgi:hypothetical protein|nr:MAG TPA: N-deoxyribosyltransferase [Caudoviricetes sp.]